MFIDNLYNIFSRTLPILYAVEIPKIKLIHLEYCEFVKNREIINEYKLPIFDLEGPLEQIYKIISKYMEVDYSYDMVIEADGYYPQLINVFVPNQTYFYELFQEIFLKQIKVNENDSIIGQEIRVTNTFYDIYRTQSAVNLSGDDTIQIHKFDDLLKTIENIINSTDSIGINQLDILTEKNYNNNEKNENKNKEYDQLLNLIENAIEKTDSVSLLLIDANTIYNDITNKVFFFGVDKNSSALEPVVIGNDTIYTLPTL